MSVLAHLCQIGWHACATLAYNFGMPLELQKFSRADKRAAKSYLAADAVASQLKTYLELPEVAAQIAAANAPGKSSEAIQSVFSAYAAKLGFRSECDGLFETYQTSGLRPDYYMAVEDSGILLEVERGKTTINNMDLLDFWKCHLCEKANYLFLMVPQELRQNAEMPPRREFKTVGKRMAAFFEPRNHTNVYGLWLFGY